MPFHSLLTRPKEKKEDLIALSEFDFPDDPFLNDIFVRPPPLPLSLGQLFFGYNNLIKKSLRTEEEVLAAKKEEAESEQKPAEFNQHGKASRVKRKKSNRDFS